MSDTQSNIIWLSKKGMKELKKNIARLERKQASIIAALHELDKIDNHDQRLERIERLAQLEIVESELMEKQAILRSAKLFPRKRDALRVALGSAVELIDMKGRIVRYTIVDSIEANPSDGRISAQSPLGRSLLGKTLQETVEWTAGLGKRQMQLVGIY